MRVPFIDLTVQYESIKSEIDQAIQEVIESSTFAGGRFVEKFENEFAEFCHSKHCIGVGSGTEALWLILLAMGIGSGDEVITVPNTFIATVEAVSLSGARPVFVDVDEQNYTMNPSMLEASITPRTKAIMPVHLFGQMADMDAIIEIARLKGLRVIEDACQAHGAEYKGRRAGSIGEAAAFSFYPGKNLGAYGEAGAVTTDDPEIARKIRMLRNHGQCRKYYHDIVGINGRMDGIQGAVLSVKLSHLDAWNEKRRKNARKFDELLAGMPGVILPKEAEGNRHVYHIYAIRILGRDTLLTKLKEKGINCAIHYPVPIHLQKAYEQLKLSRGSLPIAERTAAELLSLPMFAELTDFEMEYVAKWLRHIREKLDD